MVTARTPDTDAEITAATVSRLLARAETAEAREERALDLLQAVMRGLSPTEQTKPETQAARMAARALLAEVGR